MYIVGKVIEVVASQRKGEENFMSCIRKALRQHYGDKPVAVGGTFCVEEGDCLFHVMVSCHHRLLIKGDFINLSCILFAAELQRNTHQQRRGRQQLAQVLRDESAPHLLRLPHFLRSSNTLP